nr:unnamed protein product [Haemonchus contortus]
MPSVYNLAHDHPVINRYIYCHLFNINSYDNGNNSRVNNNCNNNPYDNRNANNHSYGNDNNKGNIIFSMSSMYNIAHDNPVFNRYIYYRPFNINTYGDNRRVNDNCNNNPYDNRNANNNCRVNNISNNNNDISEANNHSYGNDNNKGNIIFSMPPMYNIAHDNPVFNRYIYCHPFNINTYDNKRRDDNNGNDNPYDNEGANNSCRVNNISNNNNFHDNEKANNNSHDNDNYYGNIISSMSSMLVLAHNNPVFNYYI